MNNTEQLAALGKIMKTKVLNHEDIILLVFAGVLLMKHLHVPFSGLICTLIFSIIGIIYFFSAFAILEDPGITGFDRFIYKLNAFGSAVAIMGILFTFQHWPNYLMMITIGLPVLVISLIYILIRNNRRPEFELFDKWMIVRILLLIAISGAMIYGKFMK